MYIEEVKNLLKELEYVSEKRIIPCTKHEVSNLEKELNLVFPLAYKEFLLWSGKKFGKNVFCQDMILYEYIIENNKEWFPYILQASEYNWTYSENILIIGIENEFYSFDFIITNEGNNPPVYTFSSYPNYPNEVKKHLKHL